MQHSSSIILASGSARRKQLLERNGYKFRVIASDIDEKAFLSEGMSPCVYAKKLALLKAKDVAGRFSDCVVIGADTVVDFNGETIGKPADEQDAELITKKLFSAPHKVITGVAIVRMSDNTEIVAADTTIVYPRDLTAEQIAEHIRSQTWKDKAGAYAIQENGDEFVERIEGSLTNVMGLPMELLQRLLEEVIE
jgi:septum formation protein